ncbi:TetR/AcrR family transcriptional regulator [Bacillus sp. FJAT-42376]|uniref:forespore capture DNA-binding protein RefZ n=1 Tax=Bacillus sp. FJAT-42376 TaxID=2014076 RepID=UPI000F4E67F5|nr:forespore capture DNA-binding protein RefZ [Bacillus sp. FJAT-42376]AZB43948.1 TetR/AcrR family transcriptional regulator [Bacillus sp. FJAT-42376]
MKQETFNVTKEKIIQSAVSLFNTNGFTGTSVRAIAKKAGVNVAHISYYFNGKTGLMEYLVSDFYEGYLSAMDGAILADLDKSAVSRLIHLVLNILSYQHERRQLTRFVYREITLDTMLIREVMSTYMLKEKFLLSSLLEEGMRDGSLNKIPIGHFIVQLKGMLTMPFLQPQYIAEVLYLQPHEDYFVKQYFHELESWMISMLTPKREVIL